MSGWTAGGQRVRQYDKQGVHYADELHNADYISLEDQFKGRKPPVTVYERPLRERGRGWGRADWDKWWMELGGFETVTQKDENGWTAANHAIDGSSYCRCAFKAALELICETPTYVLCSHTTGSQPKGNNCLRLACDGSDRFRKRCELVALMTTNFTSEMTQTHSWLHWKKKMAKATRHF